MLLSISIKSQNLVPNGSFDYTTNCNNVFVLSGALPPWCEFWGGGGDRLNTCVNGLFGGVPYHVDGFQYPHSGAGFIRLELWTAPPLGYRGYVQAPLNQTLLANKKYIVKYFINRANYCQYAIDRIDVLLTNTPFVCFSGASVTPVPMYANPQIKNKLGVITDTLNWIEICDTMTADGNENYLMMGNFFADINTTIIQVAPGQPFVDAYYNIDDVSVEELVPAMCVNDTILCIGESIQLGLNQTETATYNWQPSIGLSCSFCANPKAEPSTTTTYVLIKQDCNIITKDSVTITVKNDCNLQAQIPNVFTPNADGINDTFKIELKNATLYNFSIYDRWGLLMHSDDIKSHTTILWDGRTTAGEACTAGVYFYTLQYTEANGDVQKKNGYITLIK